MYEKLRKLIGLIPVWIPTVVILTIVLWLTLAPQPIGDRKIHLFEGADKVVHALMFGTLALSALVDWQRSRHWHPLRRWQYVLVAALVIALGVAIEFLQERMGQGRSFEIADIAADSLGTLIVTLFYARLVSA